MNRNKMLGLLLSMDMASKNRKRSNNMSVLYGKKHCASCEFWSGVREPDACAERSRCGAYTKHHLKFGKNQADNLGYM